MHVLHISPRQTFDNDIGSDRWRAKRPEVRAKAKGISYWTLCYKLSSPFHGTSVAGLKNYLAIFRYTLLVRS